MSSTKFTPQDFFQLVGTFRDIRSGSPEEQQCTEFLKHSTASELEDALLLCMNVGTNYNYRWIDQAKVSLNIRISEQAAESANKLIQHTEKLTEQTDVHIQHSEKLTQQTDRLVKETIKLTWLTIALGVFAIVQIVIMLYDYVKHK
jgi:hypothetical protein